ncbi:uncharacterized protein BX663DRAFT_468986 [Cokeromyces recurvatus]|uniref:uncharacterized protein n=1 Tax=Cokeromyces recurvatus TaxID=90255 RepID=UPI00221FB13F|nr:uncharacterized protein BX663DRAFT_468986 [Cokeromyces recurvatus]KAI7905147.1 hypothetical protein BX663DRAFT_468986 [Cokeromyces recurvatus]
MQRRRSLEGDNTISTKQSINNGPTPISSLSTQIIPYPRGGRRIGQTTTTTTTFADDTNIILRRSNSNERHQYHLSEDQLPKKRHLFRFGKKKHYNSPSINTASVAITAKKKLNDNKLILLDHALHTTTAATEIQKRYYQQQNEKKKIIKTKNSNTNGKNPLLKLDQDFDKMDGIINRDYYKRSPAPSLIGTNNQTEDTSYELLESWAPPDSWGVQPASIMSISASLMDEDNMDFDDYPIHVQDKWNIPKKNANIKIYRPDQTYNTLHIPLNTTTFEILKKLATKFFMSDMSKYNLVIKRYNIDRVLGLTERPLQIQKILQEQMGYMEEDTIEDCSYLVRFQMMPNMTQPISQDDNTKDLGQYIDLQSRSLATIPIYLYQQALHIISLNVSRNLLIELPLDFIQMCTGLRQLWLANNEYTTLPHSIRSISSLEHLNISGNRLHDLDHAHLHELKDLRVLRAINNQLETLPNTFAISFQYLSTLFISNNSFTRFPLVVCELTSLAYLDISFNKIQAFPEEIGQLTNLVGLFAIANRITGALPSSFIRLKKLQELDIRQNLITNLDVISHLPKLEVLLVDYNSTSIVNFEIGSLKQLKMYKNHLTQFNLTCTSIACLSELNLSCCKLSSLPESVFYNTQNLERLILDSNTLNSLPSSIGVLKRLLKLSVQNNNLDTLPSEIGELIELRALDAQKNNLKSLPKEIWLCASLQTLNCSSNLIESFPKPLTPTVSSKDSNPKLINPIIRNDNTAVDSDNRNNLDVEIASTTDNDTTLSLFNTTTNAINTDQLGIAKYLDRLLDSSPLHLPPPPPTPIFNHSNFNSVLNLSSSASSSAAVSPLTPNNNNNNSNMHPIKINNHGSFFGQVSRANIPDLFHSSTVSFLQNQFSSSSSPSLSIAPYSLSTTAVTSPDPSFNPPSFFASPRNHPPPLSLSLRQLFLGDNRLTDDVWSPLSLFLELRTLNLSFNDLYEIPSGGLCHQHLYELYLSGNQLTSLPADDIERLQYLRVLAINGNKLQTLPAEIGKLRKLLVLDVGNNVLKYNIANWPYDWNWNWNLGLKYLNLSGNKRLEIQKKTHLDDTTANNHLYHHPLNTMRDKDLSDFSALTRLRLLGLMDITILGVSVPEEFHDRRVRTSPSEVNSMPYGVADWLGPSDHLSTWDLVMPRFRGKEDECIFALFDGSKHPKSGCQLTKYLNDTFVAQFTKELSSIKSDDTIVSAIRRAFLGLEQNLGAQGFDKDAGASAVVCYIAGTKLYVANVGDTLAVISRNNGQAYEITQKHIPLNPSEVSRIRAAGGYVSNSGLLNNELNVSRSFGHFHLIPVVNCNPYVSTMDLAETDEFVIIASRGLWDKMTYQTAVDIARTEKDDLMVAAQKLRDFAITYGAVDNLMVMIIGVGNLFDKRGQRQRYFNTNRYNNRGNNLLMMGQGRSGSNSLAEDGLLVKSNNKRRGKEELPGDSTLARLEREVAPPVSQLALVFTDIKGSTQLWETQPQNMRAAIKIHDAIMRRTLRSVGGYEVKTEGDAFMVCFKNITAALLWCFTVQLQLLEADWPTGILDTEEGREIEKDGVIIYRGLSVRMGIHWGAPVSERNPITQRMDYFGPVVNKASRICNAADGGQICVSSDVIAALRSFSSMFDEDEQNNNSSMNEKEGHLKAYMNFDTSYTTENNNNIDAFPISRDLLQLKQLGFHVVELGERRLKGLETPETLSLVYSKQLLGRIEINKGQMMSTNENDKLPSSDTPTNLMSLPSSLEASPSLVSRSTTAPVALDSTNTTPNDYLTAKPLLLTNELIPKLKKKKKAMKTIDPNLVCAISNLAIRLERLTSGNILSQHMAGSTIQRHYVLNDAEGENHHTISTASSGLGLMLDRHIREDATDEELIILMENCVTRVENAVSTLYLQKMDNFANVFEKLAEVIDTDPSYIVKALQMYAEAITSI